MKKKVYRNKYKNIDDIKEITKKTIKKKSDK